MMNWITGCFIYVQLKFDEMRRKLKEEDGEANMIAIILIIIAVIAIAAIFQEELKKIVEEMLKQVRKQLGLD